MLKALSYWSRAKVVLTGRLPNGFSIFNIILCSIFLYTSCLITSQMKMDNRHTFMVNGGFFRWCVHVGGCNSTGGCCNKTSPVLSLVNCNSLRLLQDQIPNSYQKWGAITIPVIQNISITCFSSQMHFFKGFLKPQWITNNKVENTYKTNIDSRLTGIPTVEYL